MLSRRILLDQNAPIGLRRLLARYEVITAGQMGWSTTSNGDLINAAEAAGFDILLTCDRNIRYQQNLAGRRLALVELDTTHWTTIRNNIDAIIAAIEACAAGTYRTVDLPRRKLRRRRHDRPA